MTCKSCPYDGDGESGIVGITKHDAIEVVTCPICEDTIEVNDDPDGEIDYCAMSTGR